MFNTILIGSGCVLAADVLRRVYLRNEKSIITSGDALVDRFAPQWAHEFLHDIYAKAVMFGHNLFNDPKYVASLIRLAVSSNFNLKDALTKWVASIDWTKRVEDQLPVELKEELKPLMNKMKQAEAEKIVTGNIMATIPVELQPALLAQVKPTVAAMATANKPNEGKSSVQLMEDSIARQEALRAHGK